MTETSGTTRTTVPPLRREVVVAGDRGRAFDVFIGQIGAWWPMGDHSVHGAGATVAFHGRGEGARIVESMDGAEDAVWGTVTRWEPGHAIGFTWHPGQGPDAPSHVTVRFDETQDGKTLVRLEHAGWEVFGEQAAQAREEYDHGWPVVLDSYVALVDAA
jgi:uncharacterized protein YndB with AHSA1/START domain